MENINKTGKSLTGLTKLDVKEKTETDTTGTQRIIRGNYQQLHVNKLDKIEEKNKFLDIQPSNFEF